MDTSELVFLLASELGEIKFLENNFEVHLGTLSDISDAVSLDDDGEIGYQSLERLINSYSELKSPNEFLRAGIHFTDQITGEALGFVGAINDLEVQDGQVTAKGLLNGPIEDGSGEDLDEIVGDNMQAKHNEFLSKNSNRSVRFGGSGYFASKNLVAVFDTFTIEEFQEFTPGEEYTSTSISDQILDTQIFSLPNALIANNAQNSSNAVTANLSPYIYDKTWTKAGATAGVNISVKPEISIELDFPDSVGETILNIATPILDIFSPALGAAARLIDNDDKKAKSNNRDDFHIDFEIKLPWKASASLTTGADGNGKITFADFTTSPIGKTIPLGYIFGTIQGKANMKASAGLTGLQSEYKYSAEQTLGLKTKLSYGKTDPIRNTSTPIKYSKPTYKSITGATLDFDVTPTLDIDLGYNIPNNFPFWKGKSALSLRGELTTPLELLGAFDFASQQPSATLGAKGEFSAKGIFLEPWDGGYQYEFYKTTFFNDKSGNLFA